MSQKRRTPRDEKHLLIRCLAAGLPGGYEIKKHRHSWHQLIFATKGVMTVATPRGHWVVPPQSAVWVPASGYAARWAWQC